MDLAVPRGGLVPQPINRHTEEGKTTMTDPLGNQPPQTAQVAGTWLRQFTPTPDPHAPLLLLCPHAGAGAAAYRPLAAALDAELKATDPLNRGATDVNVAQYPGRQDRAAEAAPEAVSGYARGLLPEVEALIVGDRSADPRPITLMGHSMGGLIAYELARLLEAEEHPVQLLVVSGTNSPQFTEGVPDHPTDDDALLTHMALLNGTDPALMAHQSIMRLALPAMKADYAAFDRYIDSDTTVLTAPILALGGSSDEGVSPVSLRGWGERTSGGSRVAMFPGGHFYINEATEPVARTIAAEVNACL